MAAQRSYSRLAEIEKRKSRRQIFVFGTLSVLVIVVFFFFGFKLISSLAGLLGDVKSGDQPIDVSDTTPPAPPRPNFVPEYTNKDELILEGTAESGSTIKVEINNSEKEIVTDAGGIFSVTLPLKRGENDISLTATDNAGNESTNTDITVVFDNEKPELEVTKPTEGQKFYGSGQKNLTLEGKTETEVTLTINGRTVPVDENGNFKYDSTLGDGENSFNIKSTDKAGNQTEVTVKVEYSV